MDRLDELVASFAEITMCDDRAAAERHLASSGGHLNDAICSYFAGAGATPEAEDDVHPPIPARRERLYDGNYAAARSYDPAALRSEQRPRPPPPPVPAPYGVAATGWGDAAVAEEVAAGTVSVMDEDRAAPPPAEVVSAAMAAVEDEDEDAAPVEGETACTVRVRFPGGGVLNKEFGSGRPVAALFRYCRSAIAGGGGAARRPFRLVQPAGAASDEIRRADATFDELGLNRCTVYLVFGQGMIPTINSTN